jgi:hypothetical protein
MPDGVLRPDWWNGVIDAIHYGRFSTGQQAKGNSTERQQDDSEKYASQHGLRVIDTFFDAGVSAFDGANSDIGDLRRLLDAAQAGQFKPGTHLLVEAFHRLSRRQVRRAQRLFDDLIDTGLVVHTLIDEQVYWAKSLDDEPHRLLFSIVMMMTVHGESKFKQQHSLDNRERERERARTTAAENGVGVPITKSAPAWIKVVVDREATRAKDREWHFELDPARLPTIQRICEDAANHFGILLIAAGLNGELDKFPTFGRSTKWTKGAVQNILGDARLIGLYQPMRYEKNRSITGSRAKRGKRVSNGDPFPYYPSAISEDLYRRVREAMRANHKGGRGRHGPTYKNLLKGLCECGECHQPVHHLDRPGPHSYLQCKQSTVRGCTNRVLFPYHRLEPLLFRLHETYQVVGNILPRPLDDSAERIAVLENRIERLRAQRKRIYERFGNGDNDPDLADILDQLSVQIKIATDELDQVRRDSSLNADRVEADSYARFAAARALIESTNQDIRLRSRKAVWGEFQRIIERVILNPDRTLTVRMKRSPHGSIQIEYVMSAERILNWCGHMSDGRTLDPKSLLLDPAISMDEVREHAYRHVRAMSHDLYEG